MDPNWVRPPPDMRLFPFRRSISLGILLFLFPPPHFFVSYGHGSVRIMKGWEIHSYMIQIHEIIFSQALISCSFHLSTAAVTGHSGGFPGYR